MPALLTLCKEYLSLLHEEGFHEGVRASQRALEHSQDAQVKSFLCTPSYQPSQVTSLSCAKPADTVECFWYCYCLARHKIETSYEYKAAEDTLLTAIEIIDAILIKQTDQAEEKIFFALLREWTQIFVANARIDRSVYNGIPKLLCQAARTLNVQIHNIYDIAKNFSDDSPAGTLYNNYIKEHVHCYNIYATTLEKAGSLYQQRWNNLEHYQQQLESLRHAFLSASKQLKPFKSEDAYIVRSDLMAHLPVLEKFATLRQASQGELNAETATIDINFFSAIDHDNLPPFTQHIDQHFASSQTASCLDLSSIGALGPIQEEMTDIWSGLANADYIKKYHWQLPELRIHFRNRAEPLTFKTSLHYYRMGVFCLSFQTRAHAMSVTELRHALSLGAPFTLDEMISFHQHKKYLFMRDVADEVFLVINDAINSTLNHSENKISLSWNSKENWFATLDLDEISEKVGDKTQAISLSQIISHPGFSGLASPLKEVRVAIDNWVTSQPINHGDNIAPLRYGTHEFIYAQRNAAVLGLLEQPSWVKEQAKESLLVAAIITNLLLISNKRLNLCVKELDNRPTSPQEQAPLAFMQAKIDCLALYEERLCTMLETIKLGTIVTYPDHARLMQGIFEHMGFNSLKENTQSVLSSVKQKHEHLAEKLSLAYEKAHDKNEKRRNYFIACAALFLSLGAINDFFDIFNINQTVQISATIAILCAMIVALFILWFTHKEND